MPKFSFDNQPSLKLLSNEQILQLHEKALDILENTGVFFDSDEALNYLKQKGANVNYSNKIVKFPRKIVIEAINLVPETIDLYSIDGNDSITLGNNNVHFDPGSAAIKYLESDGKTIRQTETRDLVNIARVTDALDNIAIQSTALNPFDIPKEIADSYRVYLLLKNSTKPMIAGAFSVNGITYIRELLAAVVGGYKELNNKPRAVFDICSSPSLKWTYISCQNIINCARYNLPIEIISMPIPGAASPSTLSGSIIIHTAETLSGIVLAQSVNPKTPIVYGGAPAYFDMRYGTTPISAIESSMIAASYAQIGKYYGLPTHTYACLSDSKIVDGQAGLETSMNGILAQLAGINVISGAGILDFVSCINLEKLVIDNEICGMVLRLAKGIDCTEETMAVDLIEKLGPGGDYLSSEHTFKWFKEEPYIPSKIIDRMSRNTWETQGSKDIFQRAKEKVQELLANYKPSQLDTSRIMELDKTIIKIMEALHISSLPYGPKNRN
jgi:trimethylamine--corrinoid protein Co-methyltransferase